MTTQIKVARGSSEDDINEEIFNLKVEWQANFSEIHFTLRDKMSES